MLCAGGDKAPPQVTLRMFTDYFNLGFQKMLVTNLTCISRCKEYDMALEFNLRVLYLSDERRRGCFIITIVSISSRSDNNSKS
jgi:hypothetical protein